MNGHGQGQLVQAGTNAVRQYVEAALGEAVLAAEPGTANGESSKPANPLGLRVTPGLLWHIAPEKAIDLVRQFPEQIDWNDSPPFRDFYDDRDRRQEGRVPQASKRRRAAEDTVQTDHDARQGDRKRRRTAMETVKALCESNNGDSVPRLERKLATILPKPSYARHPAPSSPPEAISLGTITGQLPEPSTTTAPKTAPSRRKSVPKKPKVLQKIQAPQKLPVSVTPVNRIVGGMPSSNTRTRDDISIDLNTPTPSLPEPVPSGLEMVRESNPMASVAPGMTGSIAVIAETVFSDHTTAQTSDVSASIAADPTPLEVVIPQADLYSGLDALETMIYRQALRSHGLELPGGQEMTSPAWNYGSGPSDGAETTYADCTALLNLDFSM